MDDRTLPTVTTAYTDLPAPWVPSGVYPPQEDSQLLIDVIWETGLAAGARVADLCTGSGVVAISAAAAGAGKVHGFDICPRAVNCARANVTAAGVDDAVRIHRGTWSRAAEFGPYDLVVSNPPYVPHCTEERESIPAAAGPPLAWNAGRDGRSILDPLCAAVPRLLAPGGAMLLVQSEFSGIERTVHMLSDAGMRSKVVAQQYIPFGPVLSARADWLERVGLMKTGRHRVEKLVVIRADRP